MAQSRITTDSGQQIYDGSIVILARFPGTKWIVHKGWYSYQGNQYNGWYLSSIPSQSTMPLTDTDLIGITVVSDTSSSDSGYFPSPNVPKPGGDLFTPQMSWELNRAWITVDTIEQRNRLNRRLIPDGKVVRVNDSGDGSTKYYSYDQANSQWVEETFGIDTTNFVSRDDLGDSISEEVSSQLANIDLSENISNTIQTNEDVQTTINNVVSVDVKWKAIEENMIGGS